jgi:hypothetical protein
VWRPQTGEGRRVWTRRDRATRHPPAPPAPAGAARAGETRGKTYANDI